MFGGPSTIYLSRVKKSNLYLLAVTNDSVFESAPLHITAYFRRKKAIYRYLKFVEGLTFFGVLITFIEVV